ncbi:methyltransferase domain-containing protein [Candidatus Kaiserbacteria bacterium]|nr:methyltransferase domain-containing protein [Candidatus Kaiserbacteria bacterium]
MIMHFSDQKNGSHEADLPVGDGKSFAHPPSHIAEIGVKTGMIVADLGSGSGAHTFACADATGPEGRVYAIDIQRDLLARIKNEARRRDLHHVDVFWGDLEMVGGSKLADVHVDVVLMSNILFQVKDKQTALREAWRIIKPAGVLAVIERSGAPGLHRGDVLPKEAMLALARKADFEPVREFDAGSHHYGLIFRPVATRPPLQ